ncbi:DinB family protein [Dyadobacter luticola]|uniref:DinB family protein n=1 Tax=Dyadobacter luticola TaxID=1979387 RepID=A0A5R9L4P1_9BACT|nr:DinB family protein [Dyadobacter luticola]TLV03319.1 DinB family protein [Dyadobacter luticola]
MENSQSGSVVNELIALMQNGNAHITFEEAVADLPAHLRGVTPENLPYSIWQLVEHIRIAQKDIVDFSESAEHESLAWPDDYWTEALTEVSDEQWETALSQIKEDQKRFVTLLHDHANDLVKPFPWGQGQNLMREALLIGDHNAYHTAEILVIRRLLNAWH